VSDVNLPVNLPLLFSFVSWARVLSELYKYHAWSNVCNCCDAFCRRCWTSRPKCTLRNHRKTSTASQALSHRSVEHLNTDISASSLE